MVALVPANYYFYMVQQLYLCHSVI